MLYLPVALPQNAAGLYFCLRDIHVKADIIMTETQERRKQEGRGERGLGGERRKQKVGRKAERKNEGKICRFDTALGSDRRTQFYLQV